MTKLKIGNFDLAAFDTVAASNKGAEVELLDLNNVSTGIFIKVLGSDSAVWREHINERANKRIVAQFKAQRGGLKPSDIPTKEEADADAITLLTLCTVGWRTNDNPVITFNGEELAFNAVNCARIYTELPFVRDQVDAFIGDMGNFI